MNRIVLLPDGSGELESRFTLGGKVPLFNRSDKKLDEGALEIPVDVRVPMKWKSFDGLVYITPAAATVERGNLLINDMPAGEYFERTAYATPPEAESLTKRLESLVEQLVADQETNLPDDGTWKFEAKAVTEDRVVLELIERDGGIVLERAK